MTNINCICECKYQKDGKCNLNETKNQTINKSNEKCIYYKEKSNKN